MDKKSGPLSCFGGFPHGGLSSRATSVIRFGEISVFWQNFKSLWPFIEGLLVFDKILKLLLQIINSNAQILALLMPKCWTNNVAIWSHWAYNHHSLQQAGCLPYFILSMAGVVGPNRSETFSIKVQLIAQDTTRRRRITTQVIPRSAFGRRQK